MDSEGVAQKKRVLVDALTMCLERSKVCQHVDAQTVRSVLDSGMSEMWREGELRLEYVWKILCQQPGLSPQEVAPPLLAFKAFEQELGVTVRVPQALTALPKGEQDKLRQELGIKPEDFAKTIASLKQLALAEKQKEVAQQAAQRTAAARAEDAKPTTQLGTVPAPAETEQRKRTWAIVLGVLALLALPVALYLTFRSNAVPLDLSDVSTQLKLADGRRAGPSMVARIDDPRWDQMGAEDRQKAAQKVFAIEVKKGVQSMTLVDSAGAVRAVGLDAGGVQTVTAK